MSNRAAPAAAGEAPKRGERGLALAALFVVCACIFVGLAHAGVWDPPELEVAESSRRIAHGLFGATAFGTPAEHVPTRAELGRGELPFTSIALGFRCFGLSALAGRLPLALWALVGLAALFFLVTRLATRRDAWVSVIALASMPLYFFHARCMLGDIVPMAASASSMAGFGVALFDERAARVRGFGLALGLAGLLAGFMCRGLLVGVSAPLLGIGVPWLLLALSRQASDRAARLIGSFTLFVGVFSALAGASLLRRTPDEVYSIWVGATPGAVRPLPTFDIAIRDLGHALFPLSAFVPPALGRCLDVSATSDARDRALRLLLLASAATMLVTQTAIAPDVGTSPYAAPAALAGIVALVLVDFERGAEPSRLFGLVVGALSVLLVLDFRNFPEKGLVLSGVEGAVFPRGFAQTGFAWIAGVGLSFGILVFFLVSERGSRASLGAFKKEDYALWARTLRLQWAGNLWFSVLVVAFALLGFELLSLLSSRYLHLRAFDEFGEMPHLFARAGFVFTLGSCVAPFLVLLGRDSVRALLDLPLWFSRRTGAFGKLGSCSRALALTFTIGLAGVVLSNGYYSSLLAALSPKRAFELYKERARPSEPLALLGVHAAVARYETGAECKELPDVDAALEWFGAGDKRRFLALRASELPELNAGFRSAKTPRRNLPVLGADSGEILLASNRSGPEPDANPFASWVLDRAPKLAHPLNVDLGGKLTVLGWEIHDAAGRVVNAISIGQRVEFLIFYRVDEHLTSNWDTFIHIEGFQRRYNGDHPTLAGRYPFALWLPGDVMVDRSQIELGAEFSPGSYHVFFGLYSGAHRLEVRRGANEDNRIDAGMLAVH